jgi:hypothetical protein
MGNFNWTFELKVGETARLPNLQRPEPFEQIAEKISRSMTVLCCHADPMKEGYLLKDVPAFRRAAYCVQIEKDLFDQFFNSAHGYRAAYFRSPWEGMRANAAFLNTVAPKLLSSATTNSCSLPEEFIRESLITPSAKVWLAEQGNKVE